MDDFEVEDDNRTRVVTIDDKSYLLECRDPYGFWYVIKPRPAELSGTFTTIPEAERAIVIYHNAHKPKEQTIVSTDGKGGKKRVKATELFSE